MHLCLTAECSTSGLHVSVFKLGPTPRRHFPPLPPTSRHFPPLSPVSPHLPPFHCISPHFPPFPPIGHRLLQMARHKHKHKHKHKPHWPPYPPMPPPIYGESPKCNVPPDLLQGSEWVWGAPPKMPPTPEEILTPLPSPPRPTTPPAVVVSAPDVLRTPRTSRSWG